MLAAGARRAIIPACGLRVREEKAMTDDSVILQCDKCGAKLKVRQVALKFMKEIKCGKCGNKVSTRAAPATGAAVADAPAPSPPATESASPPAPPAAPTQPAEPAPTEAPAPAVAAAPLDTPPARVVELEQRLVAAQERVVALERDLALAKDQLAAAQAAAAPAANEELAEARRTLHDQEVRLTELQALWYEKEKETRAAMAAASKAAKERDAVIGQIRSVLRSYHEEELQAAAGRITSLEARINQLFAGAPPAK